MSREPDPIRSWTEDEARAYLPRLKVLVAILRRTVQVTARARTNGHSKPLEEVPGRTTAESVDLPASEGSEDDVGEQLHELSAKDALEELGALGVIVRDPGRGLVDFPSRRSSGRVVLLCWQAGEEDLLWWHLPEDGFAGEDLFRYRRISELTTRSRGEAADRRR